MEKLRNQSGTASSRKERTEKDLPILIMDSPDQPMENASFEEIYPTIIETANEIGIQTIFISKMKPGSVNNSDLIDIRSYFIKEMMGSYETDKDR
ncbi:MAG: hypothetical protein IJ801_09665 [Lachnospiraceae bacterium]|nr:hypothetical protein [Lachnospiraceae bacterium]